MYMLPGVDGEFPMNFSRLKKWLPLINQDLINRLVLFIWKKYLGYVFVLEIKAEFSSAKSIPARKV